MSQKHILVGLTLLAVSYDSDGVTFSTEERGDIYANVEADCCSESWVEGLEHPARGYPCKVQEVRDLDLPDDGTGNQGSQDCLQVYGLRVVTDNGDLDIDYRNSSNGYYGGWLYFPQG